MSRIPILAAAFAAATATIAALPATGLSTAHPPRKQIAALERKLGAARAALSLARVENRALERQLALVPRLADIAAATARYRTTDGALADGYVKVDECTNQVGTHYVNWPLATDGAVDPLRPDVLVYAPSDHGLTLAAVEYLVYARHPRPTILGVPLDGPLNVAAVPEPFWWKHLWLWRHNPEGLFEPLNPTVRC